ncbi:MAG: (4Fe-4S)-binding protein [Dehalococcoidia bacterium]
MTSEERASEERYAADVRRSYEGEGIVVGWEPKLCIHVAECIRLLPGVFDPNARPWVKAAGTPADEIAEAVSRCPTGALTYHRSDGAPQEAPTSPTSVQPRRNGPLFVRGEVEVIDAAGRTTREARRMALCRCGNSANKPYCDLSHRVTGFQG